MEGSGQVHAPAALSRSKRACCPFSLKLEGAHRGGAALEKRKIPAFTANHTTSVHS